MTGGRRRRRLEDLALGALLFAFWLILSDHGDLKSWLMGAASCALVVAVSGDRPLRVGGRDTDFGISLTSFSPLRFVRYALWLLKEVVEANLHVARVVIDPRLPIEPRLLRFRVGFRNAIPQVVLAHSITLTPGTVTIDLDDEGAYLVHALVPSSADAVVSGAMQRGIAAAFGEDAGPPPEITWLDSVQATGELRGAERRP
jgi:multicomponent Na+:H+ antiporter subunit E